MKRIFLILLIVNAFNIIVNAQSSGMKTYPRLTFGAEWGYVGTIWSAYHHNFFSPEGYRVNRSGNRWDWHSNADVYLHGGCNINEDWNLSMYVGYAGIGGITRGIPVSIRGTRYFGDDPMKDRWLAFMDLGSGICLKEPVQEMFSCKAGCGYRLSLSRDTKLDFMISARMTYTHQNVIYDGTRIPASMINRNNALAGAVAFTMAITL